MVNKSNTSSSEIATDDCLSLRKWYVFIMVELILYFGGLMLLVVWRLMTAPCRKQKAYQSRGKKARLQQEKKDRTIFVSVRLYVNHLISTQFISGRIMLLISTIASFVSVILYLFEVFQPVLKLERCLPLRNPIFCIDLTCNAIILVHFLFRFVASNDKINFWLNPFTITDIFTVPQIFTSVVLQREWLGLRFLRTVALMQVQTVLQSFDILRSGTANRATQLGTLFVFILFGGAGFVHLLENSGELTFSSKYINETPISYGDCLYFTVVTLSTVGYGDIGVKTVCGRIFVTIFILLALALFASFIPELADFLFDRSQYSGKYNKEKEMKHIIVCGNINFTSVHTFLADFLHEDRSNRDVEVVFINKRKPDSDLKSLLKTYFVHVKYFQGTVMNTDDLDRVQMASADACLILANQNCSNPDDEDSANIMRAISLKNYCSSCPVIMQLLQFENKVYLQNIPAWSEMNGDQIICYSEIELGILAQSCLVPGFSTLLANLFSVRSVDDCLLSPGSQQWLHDYMRGVAMEIYSAELSPSFENMSYKEVVGFCFTQLNLLLVALEVLDSNNSKILLINPVNLKRVPRNSIGVFICDSFKDAKNASIFCSKCHIHLKNMGNLKKCNCKISEMSKTCNVISRIPSDKDITEHTSLLMEADFDRMEFMDGHSTRVIGNFYECNSQKLSKCLITSETQTYELKGHIILCVFSDETSPLIGLKNFLMPLRSKTIPEAELKDLLIVAEKDFIENEWSEISFFPRVRVVLHQASVRRISNLLAIERCSRCVILNAKNNYADLQNDLFMVDKEVIIANVFFRAESRNRILRNALSDSKQNQNSTLAKSDLLSLNELKMETSNVESTLKKYSYDVHIPTISKLAIESNVQFLDTKESKDLKVPNYLRKPFAFGCVFTASMLDSLLSTAYYNQNAISLMQRLINGGYVDSRDYETDDECDVLRYPDRFRIQLLNVTVLSKKTNWAKVVLYGDLFQEAIADNNSLCLGLYRKKKLCQDECVVENTHRYVITNPPFDFQIHKTDLVYCLENKHENRRKE